MCTCAKITKVEIKRINGYLTGKRHWSSNRLTDIKTREPLLTETKADAEFARWKHHKEIEYAAREWEV